MSSRPNRRDFIKSSAAAGVGFWALGGLTWIPRKRSANERINFASVGAGGKGWSDMNNAANFGQMVAVCDIDANNLAKAANRYPDARKFSDFRIMLDEMGDQIDAVTVSTPDHTHAVAAIMAMKMGKHCFCQKPLTHSIYEARLMGDIARSQGVATQMGNQGTANTGLRRSAAIIRSGVLGKVREVHVWTNRPIWPQGIDRPAPREAPSHVNWDLFLGPAPARPYAVLENGRSPYHPFSWRGWWDFGTGALGDMACHTVNMPYMALDLRDPISVEAQSSAHNHDSYPSQCVIRFEFPARGARPAVTMFWYDGGLKPSGDHLGGETPAGSGSMVIGEHGTLYSPGDNGNQMKLIGDLEAPNVEFEKSPGHVQEWVRAIEDGVPAKSNFPGYAGPLTETILLGNLAVWSGEKIEWDARNLVATNAPEVASVIKHQYRDGWSL